MPIAERCARPTLKVVCATEIDAALSAVQTERDELREASRRAEMKLRAYLGVCKDDKELPTVINLLQAALAKGSKPLFVGQDDHDDNYNGYERRKARPAVSLEKCAEGIFNEYYPNGYGSVLTFKGIEKSHLDNLRRNAKAVLEAAGVPYDE